MIEVRFLAGGPERRFLPSVWLNFNICLADCLSSDSVALCNLAQTRANIEDKIMTTKIRDCRVCLWQARVLSCLLNNYAILTASAGKEALEYSRASVYRHVSSSRELIAHRHTEARMVQRLIRLIKTKGLGNTRGISPVLAKKADLDARLVAKSWKQGHVCHRGKTLVNKRSEL